VDVGLTQFCEHYERYVKTQRCSMRQQHRASEKLYVNFAGPTLALADGSRGLVFVAAMAVSSYTFACVTADQTMHSWRSEIQRTLRFVGGTPRLIVPDTPQALISQRDRYEPQVNDTALDFFRHNEVSMLPARPYAPHDKAMAEPAVQVVERWIMARLRHEQLADTAAADAAVSGLLTILNGWRFQKIDAPRASLFASLDGACTAGAALAELEMGDVA
jgi:transposase